MTNQTSVQQFCSMIILHMRNKKAEVHSTKSVNEHNATDNTWMGALTTVSSDQGLQSKTGKNQSEKRNDEGPLTQEWNNIVVSYLQWNYRYIERLKKKNNQEQKSHCCKNGAEPLIVLGLRLDDRDYYGSQTVLIPKN